MTKKFHPIRAFIIIIVLALLIILPPLFRLLFPKIDETKLKNNSKITILTCNRSYIEEQINITVESRYINSDIDQTKITFSPMSTREGINIIESDILPSVELSYFKTLQGVQIEKLDKKIIVIINQETIEKNIDDQRLKENYFNNKLINQKVYFTNRYFECSESTV